MRPSAPWAILHIDIQEPPKLLDAPQACKRVVMYFRLEGMVVGISHQSPNDFPMSTETILRLASLAIRDNVTLLLKTGLAPIPYHDIHTTLKTRPPYNANMINELSVLILAQRALKSELTASIVICTRFRAQDLNVCLASMSEEMTKGRDIVVVDNGPDPETEAVVRSYPNVRYVIEPRAGLSRARNKGILEAYGDVVVFVDDDVRPEPGWIEPLLASFTPKVDVVCGLVLPDTLEADAQIAFQYDLGFGGMGYFPIVFDQDFLDRSSGSPHVWEIGAGANMAVRRQRVLELGGFDERIGPGAAGGCGDDSEYWHRVLYEGGTIIYQPLSVVKHRHRDSWIELKRQAYGYGFGHIVALFAQFGNYHDRRDLKRAFLTLPLWLGERAVKVPYKLLTRKPDRLIGSWLRGYLGALAFLPLAFKSAPSQKTIPKRSDSRDM